jgi:hypothetical protein
MEQRRSMVLPISANTLFACANFARDEARRIAARAQSLVERRRVNVPAQITQIINAAPQGRPPGMVAAWYFQCEIPAPRFRYRTGGPHYRG